MPRRTRFNIKNGVYHVYSRGAGRRYIFLNDQLKSAFIFLLQITAVRYQFIVHSFCVMGNHYHILLTTPKGNLSEGMKYLNSKYAILFNKYRCKDGPVFKGRFKSMYVYNDRYIMNLTRYIHLNPVEAGVVVHPHQYIWSSYLDYVSEYSRFLWLNKDIVREMGYSDYEQYVNKGNNEKIVEIFSKNSLPSILK
mgnify:CR=1 FL=1|jgi:putative transposase